MCDSCGMNPPTLIVSFHTGDRDPESFLVCDSCAPGIEQDDCRVVTLKSGHDVIAPWF